MDFNDIHTNYLCYFLQYIFTHLKLWVAVATYSFKWVKIQILILSALKVIVAV